MNAKDVAVSFVKAVSQIVICYLIWVIFDNIFARIFTTILSALTLNALIISIYELYNYLSKSDIKSCKKGFHDK